MTENVDNDETTDSFVLWVKENFDHLCWHYLLNELYIVCMIEFIFNTPHECGIVCNQMNFVWLRPIIKKLLKITNLKMARQNASVMHIIFVSQETLTLHCFAKIN